MPFPIETAILDFIRRRYEESMIGVSFDSVTGSLVSKGWKVHSRVWIRAFQYDDWAGIYKGRFFGRYYYCCLHGCRERYDHLVAPWASHDPFRLIILNHRVSLEGIWTMSEIMIVAIV